MLRNPSEPPPGFRLFPKISAMLIVPRVEVRQLLLAVGTWKLAVAAGRSYRCTQKSSRWLRSAINTPAEPLAFFTRSHSRSPLSCFLAFLCSLALLRTEQASKDLRAFEALEPRRLFPSCKLSCVHSFRVLHVHNQKYVLKRRLSYFHCCR